MNSIEAGAREQAELGQLDTAIVEWTGLPREFTVAAEQHAAAGSAFQVEAAPPPASLADEEAISSAARPGGGRLRPGNGNLTLAARSDRNAGAI